MKKYDLIEGFSKAIAEQEGFYMTSAKWKAQGKKLPFDWKKEGDPITICQRCNNPGNLRTWPGTQNSYGFALFSSANNGLAALQQQIETNIYGRSKNFPLRKTHPMSLKEFFGGQRDQSGIVLPGGYPGYAPSADGNYPSHYATFVLGKLKSLPGFPPEATIDTPILSFIT